jgi:hypothetical protein
MSLLCFICPNLWQKLHIFSIRMLFGAFFSFFDGFNIFWYSFTFTIISSKVTCRNPSLGLATKAKTYKGVNQKWNPRVTFHAPRSVGECEGMNPHIPKWTLTLEIKVSMNFWIFKRRLQGSKFIGLKSSLYH